jgi:hypothetical protein
MKHYAVIIQRQRERNRIVFSLLIRMNCIDGWILQAQMTDPEKINSAENGKF